MYFYLKNKNGDYNAVGKMLSDNRFLVYKGSVINKKFSLTKKYQTNSFITRQRLIGFYIDEVDGELIFNSNFPFSSPSRAAAVVMGRSCNGREMWTSKTGENINTVYGEITRD